MENQNILRSSANKTQRFTAVVAIASISCLMLLSSCSGWSRASYYNDKGHGRSYSGKYYDNVKNYNKSFHPGWSYIK